MLSCMRTTIELNDQVFRAAKRRATDEGKPLREIVEAALRAYLGLARARRDYRLQWRTERGRLQPGVSLEDRDALWDVMEGRR